MNNGKEPFEKTTSLERSNIPVYKGDLIGDFATFSNGLIISRKQAEEKVLKMLELDQINEFNQKEFIKRTREAKSAINVPDTERKNYFKPITDFNKLVLARYRQWSGPLLQQVSKYEGMKSVFLNIELQKKQEEQNLALKIVAEAEGAAQALTLAVSTILDLLRGGDSILNEDQVRSEFITAIDLSSKITDPDIADYLLDLSSRASDKMVEVAEVKEKQITGKDPGADLEGWGNLFSAIESFEEFYSGEFVNLEKVQKPLGKLSGRKISTVGLRKQWKVNIEDVRKLPDWVFEDQDVIAAIEKALLNFAKEKDGESTNPTVKGAKLWRTYK